MSYMYFFVHKAYIVMILLHVFSWILKTTSSMEQSLNDYPWHPNSILQWMSRRPVHAQKPQNLIPLKRFEFVSIQKFNSSKLFCRGQCSCRYNTFRQWTQKIPSQLEVAPQKLLMDWPDSIQLRKLVLQEYLAVLNSPMAKKFKRPTLLNLSVSRWTDHSPVFVKNTTELIKKRGK